MTVYIVIREPGDPGGDPLGSIDVAMTKAGDGWAVLLPKMHRTSHSLIGAVLRRGVKSWSAEIMDAGTINSTPVRDPINPLVEGAWESREAARDALVYAWWHKTLAWSVPGGSRPVVARPDDAVKWNVLDEHYPASPTQDRGFWWERQRERFELLNFLVHHGRMLKAPPRPAFHRHEVAPAWLVTDHRHILTTRDQGIPLEERKCTRCPQYVCEHISYGMMRWRDRARTDDPRDPFDYCFVIDPEDWT